MRVFLENRYDAETDRYIQYDKPQEITMDELKKLKKGSTLLLSDVDAKRERMYFAYLNIGEL